VIDRVLAEEALRKSEKLAAVGRRAATISHEINNPLESVTMLLYLIKGEVREESARLLVESAVCGIPDGRPFETILPVLGGRSGMGVVDWQEQGNARFQGRPTSKHALAIYRQCRIIFDDKSASQHMAIRGGWAGRIVAIQHVGRRLLHTVHRPYLALLLNQASRNSFCSGESATPVLSTVTISSAVVSMSVTMARVSCPRRRKTISTLSPA
jgi:signal transduction histidine kinase